MTRPCSALGCRLSEICKKSMIKRVKSHQFSALGYVKILIINGRLTHLNMAPGGPVQEQNKGHNF